MAILVRDVTIADVNDICAIHVAAWHNAYVDIISKSYLDEHVTVENKRFQWSGFLKRRDPEKSLFLIITDNENPIGFAQGWVDHNHSKNYRLNALYLNPQKTRQGYGRVLVHTFKETVQKQGYENMLISVLKENHAARKFYEKIGGVHQPHLADVWNCPDGKKYAEETYVFKL
tara:strand:- start:47440 stop:47958 length:519 start_codon:yes stop_codon:yes gene_type:complete